MILKLQIRRAWGALFILGGLCIYGSVHAQPLYFSNLFDYSQTGDGGLHVFIRQDTSYVFMGSALNYNTGKYGISSFHVSRKGDSVLHKNIFESKDASYIIGAYGVA